MMHRAIFLLSTALILGALTAAGAEDASRPGKLIVERPTLHCLGVRWYIAGNDNQNAHVEVNYRRVGDQEEWQRAQNLFRTTGNWKSDKQPAAGETLYAGSVFDLAEDTDYELSLVLLDSDGGTQEKLLRLRTRAEPRLERPARTLHVAPGTGGGDGSAANPFRGLDTAQRQAAPGDLIFVHRGVYPAPWEVRKSGEPGKPIVWRAAGDGEAVINGGAARPSRGIAAGGLHDVWFEGLAVRNVQYAIVAHESARLVVRRCTTSRTEYGLTATRSTAEKPCVDLFIADNDLTGPSAWPRGKGIENARGIQVSGLGHVICYNHIRGFADAINTFDSAECSAIDIYGNDLESLTDDGIECDYSQHNVRCFRNRLTNVYQGISMQPVHGGPVYILRNVILNVGLETFKMHNNPSGALIYHNTSVKSGMPLVLYTNEEVDNFISYNNLFIGTRGEYAFENTARMKRCHFENDGFGGQWDCFLKWNGKRYRTLEEVQAGAPVYKKALRVDPLRLFARGDVRPRRVEEALGREGNDLRLAEGSEAIDAAVPYANIGRIFNGNGPDMGALEFGDPLPQYGPRTTAAAR